MRTDKDVANALAQHYSKVSQLKLEKKEKSYPKGRLERQSRKEKKQTTNMTKSLTMFYNVRTRKRHRSNKADG